MKPGEQKFSERFLSRLAAAAVAVGFMYFIKSAPAGLHPVKSLANQPAIALGGLIIVAWVMGDAFQRIGLPRITGYMITGLIMGPYALKLIDKKAVDTLKFIDNLALSLIALHAGHEVKLRLLRARFKSILSITFFILLFSLAGVFIFVLLTGRHLFTFLEGEPLKNVILVALFFGLLEVAKSPVTTIAILDETKAKGPLAETTLGIVVLKDVILILLFGVIMGVGARIAHPEEAQGGIVGETSWHLFGSLAFGAVAGFAVAAAIKKLRKKIYLLVIGLALVLTIISEMLGLEVLLVSMTAGFIIENYTRQGDRALEGIEKASPLVYIIFFPVASAYLDLTLIKETWFVALCIIMMRKVMVFIGINVGSRLAEDKNPHMRRYGWMGFINQSGVTLALAIIIGKRFPEYGKPFRDIALAMIVITDLYGPALFKYALHKTGEAGAALTKKQRQLKGMSK